MIPIVTSAKHLLPFNRLSSNDFERLCLWTAEREGFDKLQHTGVVGSDGGMDIVGFKDDQKYIFQCKRVKKFGPTDAIRELRKIESQCQTGIKINVIFCVTIQISNKTRESCISYWRSFGKCTFWAETELDEKVKRHSQIVEEFFGVDKGAVSTVSLYSFLDLSNSKLPSTVEFGKIRSIIAEKNNNSTNSEITKMYIDSLQKTIEYTDSTINLNEILNIDWSKNLKISSLDIENTLLTHNYEFFSNGGRSFIYDIGLTLLNSLVSAVPSCEEKCLSLTKQFLGYWEKIISKSSILTKIIDIDYLSENKSNLIKHEFSWAQYKLSLIGNTYNVGIGIERQIKLRDVFVEPLANWTEKHELKEYQCFAMGCKNSPPEEIGTVVDRATEIKYIDGNRIPVDYVIVQKGPLELKKNLYAKLNFENQSNANIIIGLPGIGKSSFSRMMCSDCAVTKLDLYPVLIRLREFRHYLDISGKSWIENFLASPSALDTNEKLIITETDLKEKNILFVLDGLDEFVLSGNEKEIIGNLYKVLDFLLKNKKVNIVITSRILQFLSETEKFRLRRSDNVFYMQLLGEPGQNQLVKNLIKCGVLLGNANNFIDWAVDIDANNPKEEKFMGQPMLMSLLAHTYSDLIYTGKNIDIKDFNHAHLYDHIVRYTILQQYEDSQGTKRFETKTIRTQEDVYNFLAELAYTFHNLETDFVNIEELLLILNEKYQFGKNDFESLEGINDVLIMFHFMEGQNGHVEFFHKSFSEFLAAKFIVDKLKLFLDNYLENKEIGIFLYNFMNLFALMEITSEVERYITDLIVSEDLLCDKLPELLQMYIDNILDKQLISDQSFVKKINKGIFFHYKHCKELCNIFRAEAISCCTALKMFSIFQKAKIFEPPIKVKLTTFRGNVNDFIDIINNDTQGKNLDKRFSNFLGRSKEYLRPDMIIVHPAIADFTLTSLNNVDLMRFDLRRSVFWGADLRKSLRSKALLYDSDFWLSKLR